MLFEKWCAVLQQVGTWLPYKAENWQTVMGGAQGCGRHLLNSGCRQENRRLARPLLLPSPHPIPCLPACLPQC